jgi:hypothetical protein
MNETLKRIWTWVGSHQSYRIVSVVMVVYGAIADLGRTNNYVTALLYAIQFGAVWYLGFGSAQRGETK